MLSKVLFRVDLKRLASFDKTLIFDGKWLYILLPEYITPYSTIIEFV